MSVVLELLASPTNIRVLRKCLTVAKCTSLLHYDNDIQHSTGPRGGFKRGLQREELQKFLPQCSKLACLTMSVNSTLDRCLMALLRVEIQVGSREEHSSLIEPDICNEALLIGKLLNLEIIFD